MNEVNEAELALLEHLRRLPLRRLELTLNRSGSLVFPPFIPPSLKTLTLNVSRAGAFESLLRGLPSMLHTSRASLEGIKLWDDSEFSASVGAAFAQVLQACSSTLRLMEVPIYLSHSERTAAFSREMVPGLVSCCDELHVLKCPWSVFRAFPTTCASFTRLTELKLMGQQDLIEFTSPVWDLMANGKMPVLVTLELFTYRLARWGREEGDKVNSGDSSLARAFEAVAATLRRLTLSTISGTKALDGYGACYELGAPIGRLRLLTYLHLDLFDDGRAYHAVGQGLTAAGGCPELLGLFLLSS
jgi:hypothetical protein